MIKQDFEKIKYKISLGEAHLLSEGDTNILGACTKGSSSKTLRKQTYSEILAKQRAYSLKQGYMTTLVRKYVNDEKMISFTTPEELKEKTFEELLQERFKPYIGKRDIDIAGELEYTLSRAKHKLALLTSRILGIQGNALNQVEEFSKLNIEFKTINANNNGVLPESMSFGNVNFQDIFNEEWEDSDLKMQMESNKWLFIIFQMNDEGHAVLKGIKLWNVPDSILNNEIKNLYIEIQSVLKKGFKEWKEGGKMKNNFPKSGFNGVCHLRTKGTNRENS